MNFAYTRTLIVAALALATAVALFAYQGDLAFASGENECPDDMKIDHDLRSPCISAPALGKGADAPMLKVHTGVSDRICRQTLSLTGVSLGDEHDMHSETLSGYDYASSSFSLYGGSGHWHELPNEIGEFWAVPREVNGAINYPIEEGDHRYSYLTVAKALYHADQYAGRLRYRIRGGGAGFSWVKKWEFNVRFADSASYGARNAALARCEARLAERAGAKAEADYKALRAEQAKLDAQIAALTARRDGVREQADALAEDWGFPY